jgi:hypothetical protein
MKKVWQLLIGLGMLSVLPGCEQGLNDEAELLIDIDAEFSISMIEELRSSGNRLTFSLQTLEEQECEGTGIAYELAKSENEIFLDIQGLQAPNPCIKNPEVAFATSDLGLLAEGNYPLRLSLQSTIINQGVLKVESDRYRIQMETENGIQISEPELLKIPAQTIWGYVAYDLEEQESISNAFLEDLTPLVSVSGFADGNYGHFKLENGSLRLNQEIAYPFFRLFIHELKAPLEELGQLLDQFRKNESSIDVQLFTWDGREL